MFNKGTWFYFACEKPQWTPLHFCNAIFLLGQSPLIWFLSHTHHHHHQMRRRRKASEQSIFLILSFRYIGNPRISNGFITALDYTWNGRSSFVKDLKSWHLTTRLRRRALTVSPTRPSLWAAGLQGTAGHSESQPQAILKQVFTERVVITTHYLGVCLLERGVLGDRKERESRIRALWVLI